MVYADLPAGRQVYNQRVLKNDVNLRLILIDNRYNWGQPDTWVFTKSTDLSDPGDTIIISSGHTITISENLQHDGAPMFIIVEGEFHFQYGGSKISMPCGSGLYFLTINFNNTIVTKKIIIN